MSHLTESRSVPSPRSFIEGLEDRVFFSTATAVQPAVVPWSNQPLAQLTAAPVATPSVAALNATRPLGGNLQQQREFTDDHAFTDLVKASTGFRTLTGGTPSRDVSGWPTQDFQIPLYEGKVPVGRYNASFVGPAGAVMSLDKLPASGKPVPKFIKIGYNATTKVHTYAVDVPAGVSHLGVKVTKSLGQVKNLKVLQAGYQLANYPVFSNRYIRFLKSLSPDTLRMMNFIQTNNNTTANWSDRPKVTDATYTRVGVPWELTVQLVNSVGSGIWVCIPAHATNDYVTQLATLLKNTMAPGAKIYVEYSNEVWNQAYEQGRYNVQRALTEVINAKKAGKTSNLNYDNLPLPSSAAVPNRDLNVVAIGDRLYARRSKEISDIFRTVFGSAAINTRVRVILGGLGPQLGKFDTMLNYLDKFYGPPKNAFYAIGIAPYWGLNIYNDAENFETGEFTSSHPNATKDQLLDGMSRSISNYEGGVFARAAAKGTPFGLKLVAYEAGVDTHGPFNIAAKRAASLDPRMTVLMERYLDAWYKQGGDLLNWFQLGAGSFNSKFGSWPITESLDDLNQPKEQAFRAFRGLPAKV